MRPAWKIRAAAFLATLALVGAACGQTGQSSTIPAGSTGLPQSGAGSPAAGGGVSISGGTAGGGSGSYTGGTTTSGGGGSSTGGTTSSGGGTLSTGGGGGGGTKAQPPAPPGTSDNNGAKHAKQLQRQLPAVHLFTPQENTIGITKNEIHLCTHAALIFANAFDTKIQDLNIFWDWVNAHGGVYGRKVTMSYKDDQYQASAAVNAANQCKAENPFFMLGGIGFDQIPAVRTWAEQNHMLYIHHIAALDLSKKYSFSYLPSVEQVGAMAGDWIVKAHRNQKIGVIYRQSDNWEPGHKAFDQVLDRNHVQHTDLPVQQNQSTYSAQIAQLQTAGVQVVFVWENALAVDELVAQAKGQGYNPTWLVFPFNQETDTLGDQALNPPMEGIATWAAYSPGMDSGPYASYKGLIDQFQAQLAKYGSGSKGNDILWTTWLAWDQIYKLLVDCGPDCTRNRIVALLISNIEKPISTTAACPLDFSLNGHVGGLNGDVFKTFRRPDGSAGWKPVPGENCALKVPPPQVRPIQP